MDQHVQYDYIVCCALPIAVQSAIARKLLMDWLRTSASKNWTKSWDGPAIVVGGFGIRYLSLCI